MKKTAQLFLIFVMLLLPMQALLAQDSNVTVPDVTGLNVPQAAAELNRSGLNVGIQTPAENAAELTSNTIVSQSVAAGTSVPYGTSIDLMVVLPNNAQLIYDDNDLSLVNITAEEMSIPNLIFASTQGTPAIYPATTFWPSALRGGYCFQLWSVSRNEPKSLNECQGIDNWRTTNNTQYHFWTQSNGITQFAVQENNIQRALCPAAPPNSQDTPTRCEFYLEGGGRADDATAYIYFAYTQSAIAIINNSQDRWMPTHLNTIYNYNPALTAPGAPLIFGDANLLREEHRQALGNIQQLAPGQCVMFTLASATVTEPPEPCRVVAQRPLVDDVAFWVANFELESVIDGERRICPASMPERLTRCVLRR